MTNLENHRRKFDEAVLADVSGKGKNSRLLRLEEYNSYIERLKLLEAPGMLRIPSDSNLLKNW